MSDHIDGPRQIGDPSADLTDLFAFTSPENPLAYVLAANVFPTCGVDAIFSNAINHSIVVRRAKVAGLGDATKFETADPEIRFSCRFDALERGAADGKPVQRGTCTFPDGQTLRFLVGDEKGSIHAGRHLPRLCGDALRSVHPCLDNSCGSEAVSKPALQRQRALHRRRIRHAARARSRQGIAVRGDRRNDTDSPARRLCRTRAAADRLGRPSRADQCSLEQCRTDGLDDIRDLWNQQTPFAIDEKLRPLFLQRMKDSLAEWDMRDGKQDWTPSALAANANMFVDDFLLIDVAKPITDASHLEIEKSTLNGQAYQTGGGRTVDSDVIDILLTWIVNRDREFLEGGTTKATKPGTKNFPYLATPNLDLQTVAETVDVNATPDKVWELIGQFGVAIGIP